MVERAKAEWKSVYDIDWTGWKAQVNAVIVYLQNAGQILLIHRLRGMAQNKISAPGGKLEKSETPLEASVRELKEEVGLSMRAEDLSLVGRLHFQFTDGFSMLGFVYLGDHYQGQAIKTAEAAPFWCPQDQLPLSKMWVDDPLWLPYVLDGGKMQGYFLLECNNMSEQAQVNEQLLSYRFDWGVCAPFRNDEL